MIELACGDIDPCTMVATCTCGKTRQADRPCGYRKPLTDAETLFGEGSVLAIGLGAAKVEMEKPKEATMASKFKKGDRVKAIEGHDWRLRSPPYDVEDIREADGFLVLANVPGGGDVNGAWNPRRFELVEAATPNDFPVFKTKRTKIVRTVDTVTIGEKSYPRCRAIYAKEGCEPTQCELPVDHKHGCAFNGDGHQTTDITTAMARINHLELVAHEHQVRLEMERERANRLGDECGRLDQQSTAQMLKEDQLMDRIRDLESQARSKDNTIIRLREAVRRLERR